MYKPFITVITPTFNAASTLSNCIESVAKQNYPNIEHWVIDGCSTDGTLDLINHYQKTSSHIKYISEKDRGIFDAMNKGITLANGDWLFFLGSDDILFDNIFNDLFSEINWLEFDFVYGKVQEFGKRNRIFGKYFNIEDLTPDMTHTPFIHLFTHHQGTIIRKKLFNTYGYYNVRYKVGADIHFFLKILANDKVRKVFVDRFISYVGTEGLSSQVDDLVLLEEFPELVQNHMHVAIDKKVYYRNFSKYYFYFIYKKNIWQGLFYICKLAMKTNDFVFYAKNTIYWLKRRLIKRSENAHSHCV